MYENISFLNLFLAIHVDKNGKIKQNALDAKGKTFSLLFFLKFQSAILINYFF